MKRIYLIISFLGLFSGFCSAQMMPDSTVQVVAYWSLGDKYSYQVVEEKGNISGTDTTITEKSAEILTLEVVDETDSTYTLRVSYDDFQHSDYARMAVNEAIEKIYGKTWFNVVTDMYGTFLRVEMPETFSQAGAGIISEAVNSIAREKGLSREAKRTVESMIGSLIAPDAFTLAAIGDIAPLLFFHGGRYALSEEIEYEEDMNLLFGSGGTIKANGRAWVDEEYTDEESVVMRIYRTPDQDSLRPYFVSLFSSILQAIAPEATGLENLDGMSSLFNMDMEDYIVEEIHLDTGWPLYYEQTRYVEVWQGDELLSEQYTSKTVDIIL